ncbi:MAG: hypothetical protein LCH73_16735 [Proteobacteria bacterium]|nr:hypothetical protein [Pseudomonadota bacterium]
MMRHAPRSAWLFIAIVLFHAPTIALSGVAALAHALLGLALLLYGGALVLRALMTGRVAWVGGLPTFAAVWLLCGLGVLYALVDSGNFVVKMKFLAPFAMLPLMWAACSELATTANGRRVMSRLLLLYVLVELFIVLLQAAYFLVGVGLPPGELYESMIPGSQFNGNNLATIVVLLSIFYNATSDDALRVERFLFHVAVISILVIMFSRLALLLYTADRLRTMNWRQTARIGATLLALAAASFAISQIDYTGNATIDASLYKAKSLATIAEMGFDADSSTSSRSQSYRHFIEQLGQLGMGSAAILNYAMFTSNALFDDGALYVNPHSMVIEFGYWMGWPGLLALGSFMLVVYLRPSQGSWAQRTFILLTVLIASSIPSSAIPLPSLWLGLLLLGMLGAFDPPLHVNTLGPSRADHRVRPTIQSMQVR